MLQCDLPDRLWLPHNIVQVDPDQDHNLPEVKTKNPHTVRVSSVQIEYCTMLTSIIRCDKQLPFSC